MCAALALLTASAVHPLEYHAVEPSGARDCADSEHLMCGPNAAYLMVTARGLPFDPRSLRELAPQHPNGLSLLELIQTLRSHALDVEVRKLEPNELRLIPHPCILHVRSEEGQGHYLFSLGVHGNDLIALDATTGREFTYSMALLQRDWTGYAVVMRANRDARRVAAAISLGCSALLITSWIALSMRCRRTYNSRRAPEPSSTVGDGTRDGAPGQ